MNRCHYTEYSTLRLNTPPLLLNTRLWVLSGYTKSTLWRTKGVYRGLLMPNTATRLSLMGCTSSVSHPHMPSNVTSPESKWLDFWMRQPATIAGAKLMEFVEGNGRLLDARAESAKSEKIFIN